MPFVISCDCGKTFRVKDESAGKRGRCPGCGMILTLARPAPEPQPDALDSVDWDALAAIERTAQPIAHPASAPPGYQQPVPGYQQPASGYQQPVPGYHQPVYVPTAPPPPAPAGNQRPCLACGQVISAFAYQCEYCGVSTADAASGMTGGGSRGGSRTSRRTSGEITPGDLLKAPFGGNLFGEAMVLILGWVGWIVLLSLIAFLSSLVASVLPFALALIVAFIPQILVLAAALGWVAKRLFAVVEQYESGSLLPNTDRPILTCLGLYLLVIIPPAILIFLGLIEPIFLQTWNLWPFTILCYIAAWLYFPMAQAMAGAYSIVDPVRVVKKIIESFPMYMLTMAYMVTLMTVVGLVVLVLMMIVVALGATRKVDSQGLTAFLIFIVVAISSVVGIYGWFGMHAMLGLLLRKYPEMSHRPSSRRRY